MWLLPTLSRLSRLAAHGFYRLTLTGNTVPAEGPVLLVANHPNSLVDPLFVACAAGRPVRFLAKAPLFDHPTVGFLVRGSGAIPVHRRKDDPGRMEQNEDTFRAAYDALARGSAVALFPEGMSHSEPSLQPLKTGAARIALGAREAGGPPFPIIPIGIVLRARETFRSEALIIVGQPIEWEDLGRLGVEDRKAVHQLTDRIDEALRGVTLNLERWEDEPLVSTAEAVWAAEADASLKETDRMARLDRTATLLATVRAGGDEQWRSLTRRLLGYRRKLSLLNLSPATLDSDVSLHAAAQWSWNRLPLFAAVGLAVLGSVIFWAPYRLIRFIDRLLGLDRDARATRKLLGGVTIMVGWILLLAVLGAAQGGVGVGLALVLGLPLLGLGTQWLRDWWGDSWREARRYLLLRYQPALRAALRAEQTALAQELERINREFPSL